MKKSIIVIALIMVSLVSFAQKMKKQNVPQVAKNALLQKFPKAKEIKWDTEGKNFEASFDLNKVNNSVLFNQEGKIVETEIEIKVSQLPKNALQYLNDNHKNQKVKEAAKIVTEKGNVIYEAEIKGKDLFFDENGNFVKRDKVS
ncbi:MAG: PepSY-like domain-containing protein [Flavobacterium sp.]|nr:PepSY-like domain-containing protein [Flavobacterium sp.]